MDWQLLVVRVFAGLFGALVILGVIAASAVAGCGPIQTHHHQTRPVVLTPAKKFSPPDIPDAQVAALNMGCIRFRDLGPAISAGVVDSGYCFVGVQRYAVDVFPTKHIRNLWLKMAGNFGVQPRWEADTWVIYPSVSVN